MADHPLPEMTRLSLSDLALRIKTMKVNLGSTIEDVLTRALDPPSTTNIRRAVSALVEVLPPSPSKLVAILIPPPLRFAHLPRPRILHRWVACSANSRRMFTLGSSCLLPPPSTVWTQPLRSPPPCLPNLRSWFHLVRKMLRILRRVNSKPRVQIS